MVSVMVSFELKLLPAAGSTAMTVPATSLEA